ncbi:MAG: SUMF1/EgtB/PvdO family nonheme iron enzyme [Planctomycetes bacterium]|nr:SUMF1/EgtB/PvdO family nonheme iron enzyme [Planctomycetota bacterium]
MASERRSWTWWNRAAARWVVLGVLLAISTGAFGQADFRRADSNADGAVDISDAINTLAYLFTGGGQVECLDAVDANDDGDVDVSDPIYTLLFLFADGLAPPEPFTACGLDSSPDGFGCESFTLCAVEVTVRSDKPWYLANETALISVEVLPLVPSARHVHFSVFEVTAENVWTLLVEENRPLGQLGKHEFPVVLPREGLYVVAVRLIGNQNVELDRQDLTVGVRPDLPEAPPEILTFEVAAIDVPVVHDTVQTAAASQDATMLQLGNQTLTVILEDHTDDLLSPEVRAQDPSVKLFRGELEGRPGSEVRLSFTGDSLSDVLRAAVDPGGDEASIYLEPVSGETSPGPYICYSADAVVFQDVHPGGEGQQAAGAGEAAAAGAGAGNQMSCREMRLNVYYDNDPKKTRFGHINRMDAVFSSELNIKLKVVGDRQINTDCYGGAILDRFAADVSTSCADIALLFTNNTRIDYGGFLGQGYWARGRYAQPPVCWVRVRGSDHQIAVTACQEISHVLGASDMGCNTPVGACSHRGRAVHEHCLGFLCWNHYSIMYSEAGFGVTVHLNWLEEDRTTIRATVNSADNSATGHFPVCGSGPSPDEPSTITNSIGMRFVRIAPGSFLMGSPESERGRVCCPAETSHRVRISRSFYIGVTEVTQGQYQTIMGTNPSFFFGVRDGVDYGTNPNRPVDSVRWNDAVEFCRRLSVRSEELAAIRSYRLPTEAEWEYCCRAGTTTRFSFGDVFECNDFQDPCASANEHLWWVGNNAQFPDPRWGTKPVGQKTPNAWGLYDMHGNVYEWCQDRLVTYPEGEVSDPQGTCGSDRVWRSGSWREYLRNCRAASRTGSAQGSNETGFRVVLCVQ